MTQAEKIALKEQALQEAMEQLRNIVRRNGAELSADAPVAEIMEKLVDTDPERVRLRLLDTMTIDQVKNIMHTVFHRGSVQVSEPLELTAEELMGYQVNDAQLTANAHSWAVVRITREGTEILTCGGGFYQRYYAGTDEAGNVAYHQEGAADMLLTDLQSVRPVWLSEEWDANIHSGNLYTAEDGTEYYAISCDLPGVLGQMVSMDITRRGKSALSYSLNHRNCSDSEEGMLELPHGIWLVYDNTNLATAPQGLLVPKALADGIETGITWEKIYIHYNNYVSGLERLRLMGDYFGEEYIISVIDEQEVWGGTWNE